jgi:uncharacterized protein YggT (Ycf19 family)
MKNILPPVIMSLANAYMFLIVIRSFMGWIKQTIIFRHYWFFGFVMKAVDPLLMVARLLPVNISRYDFSPVVAIIFVEIIKNLLLMLVKVTLK